MRNISVCDRAARVTARARAARASPGPNNITETDKLYIKIILLSLLCEPLTSTDTR